MTSNKPSILIVEDEASMRKVLADKFFREGFRVFMAREGESGLEMAQKEHPDFILLDLLMPKMDGMEMLKRLRKTEWGEKANIAILTNYNDPERIDESKKQNVIDFWLKTDWSLAELVSEVKKRLGK